MIHGLVQHRFFLTITVVLAAIFATGCTDRHASTEKNDLHHISSITEQETGTELRVELDRTEIDLTDPVIVSVTIRWLPGVAVELIEPDWTQTSWTNATRVERETRFDGTAYERVYQYTVDPFLGGEYQIPTIGIRVRSQTAGKRIARLQPIDVLVRSVLDESESIELDAALGFASLPEDPKTQQTWGTWVGIAVTITSLLWIFWLLRSKSRAEQHELDPKAVLMIASSTDKLTEPQLGEVHTALIKLSESHSDLNNITHEIERVRFSGSLIDHNRVRSAVVNALQICEGHT